MEIKSALEIAQENLRRLKSQPNKTAVAIISNNILPTSTRQIAFSLQHLAAVAGSRNDTPRAARLLSYADQKLRQYEWILEYTDSKS